MRKKVSFGAMLAVLASLLIPAMVATPAIAEHVDPVFFAGNQTCATLTDNPNIIELKVEPVVDGTFTDGTLTVTIDVRDTADGEVFDWTSIPTGTNPAISLDAVFAKGGDQGNLYTYDPPGPEETEDTGLHAPIAGGSGQFADLSHISFCYDLEADVEIFKTIPNVVTGDEEITVTFVAVLAGDDPATDPIQGTCSITFTAGETEDSCIITGLDPNTTYDIYETDTGGFAPQPSQQVTTGAGGSLTEGPTFENTFTPATAQVQKVTVPGGNEAGWTFNLYLDDDGLLDADPDELYSTVITTDANAIAFPDALVDEGNYYILEVEQDGFINEGGTGECTFTVDYPGSADDLFSCVFTNTEAASAEVAKVTDPAGSEAGWEFTLFLDNAPAGEGPEDAQVGSPVTTTGTGAVNFGVDLGEGSYYILETDGPAGFDPTGAVGCVFTVVFPADAGETFTCTFTNTERGSITIAKTVSGAASTDTFTFELREGASDSDPGTGNDTPGDLLDTKIVVADGDPVQLNGLLVPGTYQVCELLPGPGWTSTLGGAGQFILVLDDSNERVCTDVVVGAGQDVAVTADNTPPPGGAQLTIGFWKNHASCKASNGNQDPVLDETLATAGGSILIGDAEVNTCEEAVNLLNKRPMDGSLLDGKKKAASNAAFNLAAQLLAAKLNVAGGAGTCPASVTAINDAQALLDAVNFDGITAPTMTSAQITQANNLATTLDQYNNGLLC